MSTAEMRLHDLCESIYRDYNFGVMTESEKFHFLAIFTNMLKDSSIDDEQVSLRPYSVQELRQRAQQNTQDIKDGNCKPIEDFFASVEL